MSDEQPVVKCRDCDRPVHTSQARARRIGSKCWRRRRARERAAVVPLPSMPAPRRAAQTGEALITEEEVGTDD